MRDVIDEQSPFHLAKFTARLDSLYNMDIEFYSDIGEVKDAEIMGHVGGTFQPYFYEPVSRNQAEITSDNEPTQIRHSSQA